jgi:Aldo/keto reductase family
LRRLADVDPGRLAIARTVAEVARELRLSSSVVALAWLRAQGGVIPILDAQTAQQLADNLACLEVELPPRVPRGRAAATRASRSSCRHACLEVELPPEAMARLGQASHAARGFPHDFLAGADYVLGGMLRPRRHVRPPGPSAQTIT